MIPYEEMMKLSDLGVKGRYTERDTMLYGLGVGFGRDPLNEKELPFVYEKNLVTVPSMASVMSTGAKVVREKGGINYGLVLHGEQRLTIHKTLPPAADIIFDTRVVGVWDKGADKGAVIMSEIAIREETTNDKLCTVSNVLFARGDGGFGGPREGAPAPHAIPDRKPDMTVEMETRRDQALLYRLSGDYNPLHSDPDVAKAAGFPMPILHGLCSYGTCCRAIITNLCDYDPSRITGFDVRFSSPVFPGETILVDLWKDGNVVSFRARVKERDIVVINNGKCTLKA